MTMYPNLLKWSKPQTKCQPKGAGIMLLLLLAEKRYLTETANGSQLAN